MRGLRGKNGWKVVVFPARVGIFPIIVSMLKVVLPICTFIWHAANFFPSKQKVKMGENIVLLVLILFVLTLLQLS